eukprot:TRINITY_DN4634_c0_g1_i1.p1 TRINITY_DN4634_c0_g1~~TRINITY_DN4634_c0_g1_i1.p1  ORF type:complete len:539 (-),score=58.06 TRINITY_DN4634_c0_g1_i1:52-1668(-)
MSGGLLFETDNGESPEFNIDTHSSHSSVTNGTVMLSSTDSFWDLIKHDFDYSKMTKRQKLWEMLTVGYLFLSFFIKYLNLSHVFYSTLYYEYEYQSQNSSISSYYSSPTISFSRANFWTLTFVAFSIRIFTKPFFGILCDKIGFIAKNGLRVNKLLYLLSNILTGIFALIDALIVGQETKWKYVMWAIIVIVASPSWIALLAILVRWIPVQRYGKISAVMALSYLLTDLISQIISAVIESHNYKNMWIIFLVVVSSFNIILSIIGIFVLHNSPLNVQLPEPPTREKSPGTVRDVFLLSRIFKPIFKQKYESLKFWLLMCLSFCIFGLRQYFLVYSIYFMRSLYCEDHDSNGSLDLCILNNTDAQNISSFALILFISSGIVSSIILGSLKDGIGLRNRSSLLFCLLTAFMFFFSLFWINGAINMISITSSLILFCFCGLSLIGPYSLIICVFPMELGRKLRTSSIIGFVEGFGYIGSLVIFLLIDFFGYDSYIVFIIIISFILLGCLFSAIFWYYDFQIWKQQNESNSFDNADYKHIQI